MTAARQKQDQQAGNGTDLKRNKVKIRTKKMEPTKDINLQRHVIKNGDFELLKV
jgi:hypothetical protein